jgi:hypothetical protein
MVSHAVHVGAYRTLRLKGGGRCAAESDKGHHAAGKEVTNVVFED